VGGVKKQDSAETVELDVLTGLALDRLGEDACSPGQRLEALLRGEVLDRIPFQIIDNTSRLVGRDIHDFFFDPVVRFKSLCAQIIRWGVPMTETASRINSYRIGEGLGAVLNYKRGEAPSTQKYVVGTPEDFEKVRLPILDKHLAQDLWLIDTVRERFGDTLGHPCCFLYNPFSWVGTYLRDANLLFTDVFDRPQFVHRMCRFATDLQLQVVAGLTRKGDCAFLSPDQYREFALPYMAELINASPSCLFYLPVPGRPELITDMYSALRDHRRLLCMGSSVGAHTPVKSDEELASLCRVLDGMNRPYQLAIDQNTMKNASPREIINRVTRIMGVGSRQRAMFRTDTLDPSTPPANIDALVAAVRETGGSV
jgi:uroporphyrinogen-III decarboxylase